MFRIFDLIALWDLPGFLRIVEKHDALILIMANLPSCKILVSSLLYILADTLPFSSKIPLSFFSPVSTAEDRCIAKSGTLIEDGVGAGGAGVGAGDSTAGENIMPLGVASVGFGTGGAGVGDSTAGENSTADRFAATPFTNPEAHPFLGAPLAPSSSNTNAEIAAASWLESIAS